jgi:type VI secretion system protein ImpH
MWDNQSKFRLKAGPLSFREFTSLLPVGSAYVPAVQIARYLSGMEFDFDLQLVLKAHEVPRCILTSRARRKPMLGWTTWLKTGETKNDDSQVVLSTRFAEPSTIN